MIGNNKTILVTGGAGYLGSVLVPLLLKRGYSVKVLDRFFFGKKTLVAYGSNKNCTLIEGDTRWHNKNIFKGVYAVIDLAALANDFLGELDPERTLNINYRARVRTATLAKEAGVKRYILASSCSVYGFRDGLLTEKSSVAPITTYAKANVLAEKNTLTLADNKFSVTALRQGTLYGISPRMRFDLVVNTMTLSYFKDGKIKIAGGNQWRPLINVEDSAKAFIKVLEAKKDKISGQIFNVCDNKQNFLIKKLGLLLGQAFNDSKAVTIENNKDRRSYKVSSKKIEKMINYKTKKLPPHTAIQIYKELGVGSILDTPETKTLEWYKKLINKDPLILDRKFS